MVAKSKFKIGDRVTLALASRELQGRAATPHGTVVGFGRADRFIRVQRDGQKVVYTWHEGHWTPYEPDEFKRK